MSVAFSAGALCTHNAQSERNFGPGGNGAGETANGVTRASLAGLKARAAFTRHRRPWEKIARNKIFFTSPSRSIGRRGEIAAAGAHNG